jgi:hypothetical protein
VELGRKLRALTSPSTSHKIKNVSFVTEKVSFLQDTFLFSVSLSLSPSPKLSPLYDSFIAERERI